MEGVEDTIEKTKKKGKFQPNVHILMTLAAVGAVLIGNAEEGALLILIFAGAHFLEEYVEEKSRKSLNSVITNESNASTSHPRKWRSGCRLTWLA